MHLQSEEKSTEIQDNQLLVAQNVPLSENNVSKIKKKMLKIKVRFSVITDFLDTKTSLFWQSG